MRSKPDQEAAGQIVGVVATGHSDLPRRGLRIWLAAADITEARCYARGQSPPACPASTSH